MFDFTYFGLCVLSGCKYALVCIDHHAGRVWGETFVTKEQADVAMWLFKFLLDLGLTPDMLHCDNGGEFINGCMAAVFQLFEARDVHGRPRHPQSQV